ncbi:MAG: aminotransferase class I/II-fold pyridoxal phosphate-dependent enzyme [Mogibacterium sp.]|nr:aminotransferase class I/II-fold pyridoxal phosphate-dependent enzyme [Mogibacterium sp.]
MTAEPRDQNCIEALHGGDVYRNNVELDFSVNLNPSEIPERIKAACTVAADDLRQYPDHEQLDLRNAIAAMDGVDADSVICGNGASELIMAAVHALRPKKALITSPCYAGYRVALGASDAVIEEHQLKEEDGFALTGSILDRLDSGPDMVFLGNPNNPNGGLIDDELLDDIKKKCREMDICLVIDECFLPLTARGTEVPAEDDKAIHLRALTKTFALPAIRLGYAVCMDSGLREMIRRQLPEWNVSLMAQRAGCAAVSADTDGFLKESVKLIEEERAYLADELRKLGIKVFPSDTNYLLLRSRPGLYENLLAKGILIRRCANFSGLDDSYFRVAVRGHEDNIKLVNAIGEVI